MSALAPRPKFPTLKFPVPGTKHQGTIILPPEDSQVREFGTDKLKFWPDGNPVMQTRVVLRHADGTEGALYASGRMARAITNAIVAAGEGDLEVGGQLAVEFTHLGEGKGAQPPKEYEASYVPPSASADYEEEPPF